MQPPLHRGDRAVPLRSHALNPAARAVRKSQLEEAGTQEQLLDPQVDELARAERRRGGEEDQRAIAQLRERSGRRGFIGR